MSGLRVCSPHCGLAPETTSGGETYERELLLALAALGVRLELILARGKPAPEGVANVRVHRLPIRRGLRWPVARFLLPPYIKRVWDAAPFDVLRAHSLRFIGPAALAARRRYGLDVPVIAHHHHLDPSPWNGLIDKRVLDGSDHVITVSEFSRRQLAQELGVRTEHVSVVAEGVDPKFVPAPRRPDLVERYGLGGKTVALFLGGLKSRKNLFLLLDVWRAVAAARPDARLVIAGAGPLRARLRARAERPGLAGRVVFTGYVSQAEQVAHYNLADVFFFPSALEGFGLAVAEAMACGLPVVASNRGSLPEVLVAGEGGFLCDPDAPATLVEKLLLLLADAPLREKLGRANRERAARLYRWDRCARETLAIYERVVAAWRDAGRGAARP
ncbi:MAG: glycosyltransferase family 4 protein [Candidatus Rokubacteria bacterium]|nr:glycosyltransferase family 4 protein [Candidatus Rokubacteria bacterium]